MKNAKMAIAHGLLGIALTGCLAGNNQQFFSTNFVCNTLGDKTGSGLKGKLYYLNQAQVAQGYSGVADFLNRGTSPDVDFYLGRLFTPTRPFAEGFRLTNTGEVIKDANGQELIEHFAFHFTSKIQLPAGAADRRVQFALLTDDGSRMVIHRKNTDGSTSRVVNVNNDGNHPTKLGCGTAPVNLSSSSALDIEIDYYQGPRYHIALTLLWREWPSTGSATDARCGQEGNNLWFDSSTTPSTPQPAWNDLMTRWQVVPSEVFIPEAGNPCL